jgi:hypothetical protein
LTKGIDVLGDEVRIVCSSSLIVEIKDKGRLKED